MLGHDPEQVENLPLADIASDDRTGRPWPPPWRGPAAGRHGGAPGRRRRPAAAPRRGRTVPFELSIVNLLDDPTVGGFVVTAHDITARTAVELGLRNALSLLHRHPGLHRRRRHGRGHATGAITSFNGRLGRDVAGCPRAPWTALDRPTATSPWSSCSTSSSEPEAFLADRGALLPPRARDDGHPRVQGRPGLRALFHAAARGRRDRRAGSGASATSPNGSVWRTSSPIRPSTIPSPAWPTRPSSRTGCNQAVARIERTRRPIWPSCSWTWTTSRPSTTAWATRPGTRCCGGWPRSLSAASASIDTAARLGR